MSGEFESILDRSLDEVKKPELIPAGPWLLRGASMRFQKKEYEDDDTGETVKYTQVVFGYDPIEALPGVDPERASGEGIKGVQLFVRRNVKDPASEYKVLEFVRKHGLDTEGRTWGDLAKAFRGSQIVGNVTEETYTDKDTGDVIPVNRIDGFQAAG